MTRALLFDCDGVLADTERDGHLVAFNRMWQDEGVDWQWSTDQYARKVKIGGGKERMASLRDDRAFRAVFDVPSSDRAWWEIVRGWHTKKSAIYKELIASGALPPRPGVRRLAQAAHEAGWTLAVCSTSAVASVEAVLRHVMGQALAGRFAGIFAGDMVKAKKPAPDVYTAAVDKLRLDPAACLVVEDSRNGLLAARGAQMRCLVTYNDLTKDENFEEAAAVVSDLGDPQTAPITVAANRSGAQLGAYITIEDLEQMLS